LGVTVDILPTPDEEHAARDTNPMASESERSETRTKVTDSMADSFSGNNYEGTTA
jgi:hypothetical protein